MTAETSSVADLRKNGFHEEAAEIERIVEEKIKKINNALDKFYDGLSQMSPEETVELFTNVLTFPFTPEGLVYRGVGKASRSAFRTTTRTVPTMTTRTVPTTSTRTLPMTATKRVPKKTTGPTSNQPIRRNSRIAEKRKLAGTEQAGSGSKRFAPRSTCDILGEDFGTLTRSQKRNLEKLDNIINNHLKESDFLGTLKDLQGEAVPKHRGGYFNHYQEMIESFYGLKKIKRSLVNSLKNPFLDKSIHEILKKSLEKVDFYIKKINDLGIK